MKSKIAKILIIIPCAILIIFGILFVVIMLGGDDKPKTEPVNAVVDVVPLENVTAEEDSLVYKTEDMEIVIEPDDEELEPQPLSGETSQGVKWTSEKSDASSVIHMEAQGKKLKATVKTKKKVDTGKAAQAASTLISSPAYKKGVDDYDHGYSIYYIEAAECLLYYPSQLRFVSESQEGTLTFKDSRSSATLKVVVDENPYTCMDEVEEFIANSEYNFVLASGSDWFSSERAIGKNKTEFSYTGLGQHCSIDAALTYENKYDFVFGELRRLIKCRFVEGGKWVSNARADTVGKVSPINQKKQSENKQIPLSQRKYKKTYYAFEDWDCVLSYPDLFTKAYDGEYGEHYFTDPVTGAYIMFYREEASESLEILTYAAGLENYEVCGDHSLKGNATRDEHEKIYHYISIRNGYEYHAALFCFDYEADELYDKASEMLSIAVEGDELDTNEMKDYYFPLYSCTVTVPLQFKLQGEYDGYIYFHDSFNGLDANIKMEPLQNGADPDNIFNVFSVNAKDSDLILGNNIVRWHNADGLYVGAVSKEYTALMSIDYPVAYTAYQSCWRRFYIKFSPQKSVETPADKIEEEVAEYVEEHEEEEPTEGAPTEEPEPSMEPQPTEEPEPQPTEEPEEEEPTEGAPVKEEQSDAPEEPDTGYVTAAGIKVAGDDSPYEEIAQTILDVLEMTVAYDNEDLTDFVVGSITTFMLDGDYTIEKFFDHLESDLDFALSVYEDEGYGYATSIYTGYLDGYEDYGMCSIYVEDYGDYTWFSYLFEEPENMPVSYGEVYCKDCTSYDTYSFFPKACSEMYGEITACMADPDKYIYVFGQNRIYDFSADPENQLADIEASFDTSDGPLQMEISYYMDVCYIDENGELAVAYPFIYFAQDGAVYVEGGYNGYCHSLYGNNYRFD